MRVAATVGLKTPNFTTTTLEAVRVSYSRATGYSYFGNLNMRFSKWKTLGYPLGKCLLSE